MTGPPPERPAALVATTVAVTVSCFVIAAYFAKAGALVSYPWDWSPDEGLHLDWGRRAAMGLRALYGRSTVPFPAVYGPGLPLLLAPFAPLGPAMLQAARVLAVAWTALGAFAVFLLVRPVSGRVAALVAAALSLAAFDYSFWSMLVRPDGPMLTLWLLAAVALLPARLARGADALDWRRIAVGSALLLAAVVTKPTIVIHAAPLVVGWLVVDRRSAVRLGLALAVSGVSVVLLLEWLTGGSFLWLTQAWALQATQPGLARVILGHAGASLWPLVALAVAALAAARGRRAELLRDASILLVAGAALITPFLDKHGASWNYMLPFLPALSVLTVRWWTLALPTGEASWSRRLALAAGALLALALARTHEFPLPSALDERTARAFYGFVVEHTRRSGGPILATRPELAYFLVGQTVEMEGASFTPLARQRVPGPELVLQRLRERRYTLIVELHLLPEGAWAEAAAQGYVHAGGCNLIVLLRHHARTLLHPPGPRPLHGPSEGNPLRRARRGQLGAPLRRHARADLQTCSEKRGHDFALNFAFEQVKDVREPGHGAGLAGPPRLARPVPAGPGHAGRTRGRSHRLSPLAASRRVTRAPPPNAR